MDFHVENCNLMSLFYHLVDIFCMKTCSFRGAQPQSVHEGLFCDKNGPNARYQMAPCGNQFCTCCFPAFHWKKSQPWTVVDFVSSSTHQFLNGYTTYLNFPVVCILRKRSLNVHPIVLFASRHVQHRI